MIHPDTRLVQIDAEVGAGVIATRRIEAGTVTWVQDVLDRPLAEAELAALPAAYLPLIERWTFSTGTGQRVLCWDAGRYLNHSCAPNCGGTEFGFEVALRDIEPGEQLCNDYATLFMEQGEGFACRCGAPACRGEINHLQVPDAVAAIRAQLAAVIDRVEHRPQPLAELLDPARLQAARASLAMAQLSVVAGVAAAHAGWQRARRRREPAASQVS